MGWFSNTLRGRRRRATLICYLRENGPIAYELSLFGTEPRPQLDALLETGFAWFWRSNDDGPRGERADWTQVTRWSIAALLTDLASAQHTRVVTLMGFQSGDMPNDLSDARVMESLRAFLAEQEGPLQVVVRRRTRPTEPDDATAAIELVFVAQQPPEPVRVLMQAWGIDAIKADRRAYARLRDLSLEDWLRALAAR